MRLLWNLSSATKSPTSLPSLSSCFQDWMSWSLVSRRKRIRLILNVVGWPTSRLWISSSGTLQLGKSGCGVGFEPTTPATACKADGINNLSPGVLSQKKAEEVERKVVAGVGFEPTTSGL